MILIDLRSVTSLKLGQPQPDLNFDAELNNKALQLEQ